MPTMASWGIGIVLVLISPSFIVIGDIRFLRLFSVTLGLSVSVPMMANVLVLQVFVPSKLSVNGSLS